MPTITDTPTPANMSMDEFFEALGKCRDQFSWGTPYVGTVIRGRSYDGINCCPVTAVCLAMRGEVIHSSYFLRAASLLGLSGSEATQIASAADFSNGYSVAIRQRLETVLDNPHPTGDTNGTK